MNTPTERDHMTPRTKIERIWVDHGMAGSMHCGVRILVDVGDTRKEYHKGLSVPEDRALELKGKIENVGTVDLTHWRFSANVGPADDFDVMGAHMGANI